MLWKAIRTDAQRTGEKSGQFSLLNGNKQDTPSILLYNLHT